MRDTETFQLRVIGPKRVADGRPNVFLVDDDELVFCGNILPDSKVIDDDVVELAVEVVLAR